MDRQSARRFFISLAGRVWPADWNRPREATPK
jgi:hypothetical protein